MSDLFNEIAKTPPFFLALGGLIAFAGAAWVIKVVGQVVYVLLTGHVPQGPHAYGNGVGVEVDAGGAGGVARWLFGDSSGDGGWGGDGGDGGGDGGGGGG